VVGHLTEKPKKRVYKRIGLLRIKWLYNSLQILTTFTLVTIAWSLFRANSLRATFTIFHQIILGWHDLNSISGMISMMITPSFSIWEFVVAAGVIPAMFLTEHLFNTKKGLVRYWNRQMVIRWGTYYALLILIFLLGKFDNQTFLYFQF